MKYLLYGMIVLLLSGMLLLGIKAYSEAKAYEETTHTLIEEMSAEKLAAFQLKELAETVSLGFYKNKTRERLEGLKKIQQVHKKKVNSMHSMHCCPFWECFQATFSSLCVPLLSSVLPVH